MVARVQPHALGVVDDEAHVRGHPGRLYRAQVDAEDARARAQLKAFRRGRCLMRDYEGRVGAIQVDPVERELLVALDTTPVPRDLLEDAAVNGRGRRGRG